MRAINGRRLVRVVRGMARSRDNVVRVRCVECGDEVEVTARNWRLYGCRHCRSEFRVPRNARGRDSYRGVLAQSGQECPEVWRDHSEKGRNVAVNAVVDLVNLTGPLGGNEVAAMLGVSRQRVRQIELVALKKVRLAFGKAGREYHEHTGDREDLVSVWDQMVGS